MVCKIIYKKMNLNLEFENNRIMSGGINAVKETLAQVLLHYQE